MKKAVVTGASSGIGREFCVQLDKLGYSIIMVARRKEKLEQLQNELVNPSRIITLDLSKNESCYELVKLIENEDIEVFINNAGVGICGNFLDSSIDQDLEMISLNIDAVHILTKLMVQKMKTGYLLNVASSAGLLPAGPYMTTYYATKSYVVSMTRGLAKELENNHSTLYLGILCPGPVNTEFNQVAGVKNALKGIEAKECVRYTLKKMKKRKQVIIPGLSIQFVAKLAKVIPSNWMVTLTARQQQKKL